MAKKLHPALKWERDQIARAVAWTACQYIGRGYDTRDAATREEAEAIARTMPAQMGNALIYGITPEGWTIHAGTITPDEETIMTDTTTIPNDNGAGKAPKAKGRAKGKPVKRPAKAKASPPAAPKEPKALQHGKTYTLKRLVLENPNITVDDLDAALLKRGFASSKSMAASFKGDLIHTLRLLAELGMLDWPPKT